MSGCHCDCCQDNDSEEFDVDDTVSTFGTLPPAPAPIPIEDMRKPLDDLFNKYPGARMNMGYLIGHVLQTVNPNVRSFRAAEEQVRNYLIDSSQPGGWLTLKRGREGGIFRNEASAPAPIKQQVEVKASVNEKPCRSCGRNNDLGVHKCWNCECISP